MKLFQGATPACLKRPEKIWSILTEVMVKNGFAPIQSEWWHFNDAEYKSYPFIDLSLEEWVNSYFAK
jgi:D-alanyl-D-alanine dipeptidase